MYFLDFGVLSQTNKYIQPKVKQIASKIFITTCPSTDQIEDIKNKYNNNSNNNSNGSSNSIIKENNNTDNINKDITDNMNNNTISNENNIIYLDLKSSPTVHIDKIQYSLRNKNNKRIDFLKTIKHSNIETIEQRIIDNLHKKEEIKHKEYYRCREAVENLGMVYYRVPISSRAQTIESRSIDDIIEIYKNNKDNIFIINGTREYICLFVAMIFSINKEITFGVKEVNNHFFISNEDKNNFNGINVESNKNNAKAIGNIENKNDNNVYDCMNDIINSSSALIIENKEHIIDKIYKIFDIVVQGEFKVIKILVKMLGCEEESNFINNRYNIFLEYIIELYLKGIKDKDKEIIEDCIGLLEKYMTLILYVKYSKEYLKDDSVSFIDYMTQRDFIMNIYDYLKNKEKRANVLYPINCVGDLLMKGECCLDHREQFVLIRCKNTDADIMNVSMTINKINISVIKNIENINYDDSLLLDIKEEPCVYVDNQLYNLREIVKLDKNITLFKGAVDIDEIECYIKKKVIDGKIKIYENGKLIKAVGKVCTQREYFLENIKHKNNNHSEYSLEKNSNELNLQDKCDFYKRVPITSRGPILPRTLDFIANKFTSSKKTNIYILCNSINGRGAYCAIAIGLIQYIYSANNNIFEHEQENEELEYTTFDILQTLIRILYKGDMVYNILNVLFKLYFKVSFINFVNEAYTNKKYKNSIKRYFILLCYGSYLLEIRDKIKNNKKMADTDMNKDNTNDHSDNISSDMASELNNILNECYSFNRWFSERRDIMNLYNIIFVLDFKILEPQNENKVSYTADHKQLIQSRSGRVLSHMTILKKDVFPGLNVLNSNIDGVNNYRMCKLLDNIIIGVSMPVKEGIKNVIKEIENEIRESSNKQKINNVGINGYTKNNSEKNIIHWFCMREEPVVFINNVPYVLRYYSNPHSNIESTGVKKETVEHIEYELKNEIMKEKKDDMILLHDEAKINDEYFIHGKYTEIKTILTPKELFDNELKNNNLIYHRVPVTDEREPIPEIIDYLCKEIKKIEYPKTMVFNCQMGRGRTTTGMLISYLISLFDTLQQEYHNVDGNWIEYINNNYNKYDNSEYKDIDLKNEYELLENLKIILKNYTLSKNILDYAIYKFKHIVDIKHSIDKAFDIYSKHRRGFLMRYYYLIVFVEYLIDGKGSFEEYLKCNKEIDELARNYKIQIKQL